MNQRLEIALKDLEQAIAAESCATPATWPAASMELARCTEIVTRLIRKASPLDIITARREIQRMMQPPQNCVDTESAPAVI